MFVYHLGFEKRKNKIEIHIKNYLMHGNAKVLYYVYIGNDDKVVLNSYIWITYSHILMLMFLQLVRSINCKRKKSHSFASINCKRKCYSGIILNHMRTCCIYQL